MGGAGDEHPQRGFLWLWKQSAIVFILRGVRGRVQLHSPGGAKPAARAVRRNCSVFRLCFTYLKML